MPRKKKDTPEVVKVEPKPVETKKPAFYIADGKSLTSKKGILGPGDEIKAEYVAGGQETIDRWVESGYIKKG